MNLSVNPISANAISKSSPAFQSASAVSNAALSKANLQEINDAADTVEIKNFNVKKEAPAEKKLLSGLCSFFIPGLGQAINGQWGKAVGFLLGSIIVAPLSLSTLGLLGLPYQIWSAYDAAKNAKA